MTPGTRVRIVGEYYPDAELSPGKTGKVFDVDGDFITVVMDSGYFRNNDQYWPFYTYELEVIE